MPNHTPKHPKLHHATPNSIQYSNYIKCTAPNYSNTLTKRTTQKYNCFTNHLQTTRAIPITLNSTKLQQPTTQYETTLITSLLFNRFISPYFCLEQRRARNSSDFWRRARDHGKGKEESQSTCRPFSPSCLPLRENIHRERGTSRNVWQSNSTELHKGTTLKIIANCKTTALSLVLSGIT